MDPFCEQFLPRSAPLPYYGDFFSMFFEYYFPIHKTVIYPVIIFGLISNTMLMIVLTRKKMMNNVSNIFLIGISICDITTLIIYFFMSIPMIAFDQLSYQQNFWFINLLSPYVMFRSVSTWVTVLLALYRVISLYFPFQTVMKLDIQNARNCIIFSSIASITPLTTGCITHFVENSRCEINKKIENLHYIGHKWPIFTTIAHTTDAVFMQLIPCAILVVLVIMLVYKLKMRYKLRENIKNVKKISDDKKKDQNAENDQTSNALLAIVILFLICEFPTGVILSTSLMNEEVYIYVVLKTHTFFQLMRLLNASLNFILYCIMSAQFRSTFAEIFHPYVPMCLKSIFGISENIEMKTPSRTRSASCV